MKSEEELVEESLNGNHASFELLLRPYRQGILNMAVRMTGNTEDAKEVCQEAIIKVYKYLKNFRKGQSFRNWFLKILVNSSYDFLRKRKKSAEIIERQMNMGLPRNSDVEQKFLQSEIREKIQVCLQDLTPKEKSTFLLRDQEGYSIQETSEVLGVSTGSVRTHLSRARRKIRRRFQKICENKEVRA
ncbi:MAG: sigma-70 family RNA polymerase sigma factor [Candidatus Aminicenantes bacterium]|nr:sigma-70 family RNA polymerase sigma factor [Candidatus Aminicenantes bacterium]